MKFPFSLHSVRLRRRGLDGFARPGSEVPSVAPAPLFPNPERIRYDRH
jgi:hypothetical protein